MTNAQDSAFHNYSFPESQPGLTKREYIATAIYAEVIRQNGSYDFTAAANEAVKRADALIAALNK